MDFIKENSVGKLLKLFFPSSFSCPDHVGVRFELSPTWPTFFHIRNFLTHQSEMSYSWKYRPRSEHFALVQREAKFRHWELNSRERNQERRAASWSWLVRGVSTTTTESPHLSSFLYLATDDDFWQISLTKLGQCFLSLRILCTLYHVQENFLH